MAGEIDRVGMSNIETMLQMQTSTGQSVWVPAKASVYVNMHDKDAKGIHMSRLYLTLQDELQRDSGFTGIGETHSEAPGGYPPEHERHRRTATGLHLRMPTYCIDQ